MQYFNGFIINSQAQLVLIGAKNKQDSPLQIRRHCYNITIEMIKGRRKKEQQESSQSQQGDKQGKVQQKKLSEYRDYISMKAANNIDRNKKKQPKKQAEKHSMKVHAHLQPDLVEDDDELSAHEEADPIALMSKYTTEEYRKFIKVMEERVANEKPKTDVSQPLLDALALTHTNICIYGFGSKIQYLRHIVHTYLCDHFIWEVNGYREGMTDKKVYNNFGKFLQALHIAKKINKITIQDQLLEYRMHLTQYAMQKDHKELVVMFHCIDAYHFLNSDAQKNLSQLFSLPKIKLICTIDNIKISSIWSPQIKTNYSFKFFHIDTFVPNIKEQYSRPNPTDARQRQDQSLIHIFQSLNNNQKRILKLFAKKQLQNDSKDQLEHEYYTLETLLEQCIDNVILSNDTQLRENLLELIDHKVLVTKEKMESDRVRKYYMISCNKGMLEKIYQEKIQD